MTWGQGIPCDDCGKPCGDGAVPVINDAQFIVGYCCRHCVQAPPLCEMPDCHMEAMHYGFCATHWARERNYYGREL